MKLSEKFGPEHVVRHFENICAIPHPSGHEETLGKYVTDFAEKHGHDYFIDEAGNIIVYVKATPGCEKFPAFLMQAHMDMVPAKSETSQHNFLTDPIELRLVDDRYLYACGTTLGADNAVGMMNMLALMEDKTVKHPPIELLFTVSEETGLAGVRKVDFSKISARRMMNMDCGDPDTMCVSTAGAAQCLVRLPLKKVPASGRLCRLTVGGLLGGHGGLMIDYGHLSAVTGAGRVLYHLAEKVPFNIVYTALKRVSGIAPEMTVFVSIDEALLSEAKKTVGEISRQICAEYADPEKDMFIRLEEADGSECPQADDGTMLDAQSTQNLCRLLYLMPFGVTKRDWREKETILCSNNTVEINLREDAAEMETMTRAPADGDKEELVSKMKLLAELCGASLTVLDSFAGWPYMKDSPLQELCRKSYRELTGEELKIEKENSCAETGIIIEALPGMDAVALAPLGRGAHTPDEHLDMLTVEPFWKFLVLLLKNMCE